MAVHFSLNISMFLSKIWIVLFQIAFKPDILLYKNCFVPTDELFILQGFQHPNNRQLHLTDLPALLSNEFHGLE